MSEFVFCRHEMKYWLTPAQYAAVIEGADGLLTPDHWGRTTIQSLYYDTPDDRLIRRSMEKPAYKEKLRLRGYGLVRRDAPAFLEIKKKCMGVVYKRRIAVTEEDAAAWQLGDGQIAREITYFRRAWGDLAPRMLLLYDRTAYTGAGDLRVTFDRNIRYRTERLTLSDGLDGIPVAPPGAILMEIKTAYAIPLWLVHILSREGIRQTSYSKYAAAYGAEMKAKTEGMKVG